ncbi:6-hydroxy-D-nicotine oxidase [Cytospora mali]|uniref:6-hydroxy-D-nicotine oxidase n=1 Tax=Cytospora mali TaxID=578113 RepID=A0A194VVD0_CYTMA|nr:6-hydroxy-D-nicotine oxidase [Valsa mali]
MVSISRKSILTFYYIIHGFVSAVSCIATEDDWKTLSNELHGNLHAASPLARPCFSNYDGQQVAIDQERCTTVQNNWLNASFRTSQFPGFLHLYGDGCISNFTDKCILNHDDPTSSPIFGECNPGIVSPWYVDVRGPDDVQAAFKFARRTGTRISIKATGHDYVSRSSLKGSLGLWTHNLKNITYHPSFTPAGCASCDAVPAMTLGAGVNIDEATRFAGRMNVTVLAGSSPTIALAGGWGMFGGHGVLSPRLGLGVDRVLEVEIVTPDGQLRICNAENNADLFWALRGAGGGSFGVVLRTTVKVEPAMPVIFAYMSFVPTDTNQKPFVDLLINHTKAWVPQGWGGAMSSSEVELVTPLLDVEAAATSMAEVSAYVEAHNGTVSIRRFANYLDFYNVSIGAPSGKDETVGQGPLLSFRVLPKAMHDTAEGKENLSSFLHTQVDLGRSPIIFLDVPYLYDYAENTTSVHPAWRDSYWYMGFAIYYLWNSTEAERVEAAGASQQLSKDMINLAPEGAAYPNEANPWLADWQNQFWGENYPRLVDIKARYDPDGLVSCWKCVGF